MGKIYCQSIFFLAQMHSLGFSVHFQYLHLNQENGLLWLPFLVRSLSWSLAHVGFSQRNNKPKLKNIGMPACVCVPLLVSPHRARTHSIFVFHFFIIPVIPLFKMLRRNEKKNKSRKRNTGSGGAEENFFAINTHTHWLTDWLTKILGSSSSFSF